MVLRLLWGSPFGNFFLTSKPYPAEDVEAFACSISLISGRMYLGAVSDFDSFTSQCSAIAGTLQQILKTYNHIPEDAFETQCSAIAGTLQQILKTYNHTPEDAFQTACSAISGTLRQILITYTHRVEDAFQSQCSCISGTLT